MERGLIADREILVLEDELMLRKRAAAFLEQGGAEVVAVDTLAKARVALKEWTFDFALVDIQLPDGEGLDLLKEGAFPETTSVVVMTSDGGVGRAVEAMQLGAADFLAKPFDHEELPIIFRRCQRQEQAVRLLEHRQALVKPTQEGLFFGRSLGKVQEQLERILEADQRLATALPPVLISGATGTGKSTFARWIHRHGPRADQEIVEVNCSTLPDNLAESELFGHERGAFTDARKARMGLFEAAHQGTLFLDEVPSLSAGVQAKLLTAIEDRKIRRVGGNKDLAVDVRVIAATNADLQDMIAKREFREDLYHRLNLLTVDIPPLRDRVHDIVALANHLLGQLSKRYQASVTEVPKEQEGFLLNYDWPGNVRELMHELERQLVWGRGEIIDFSHLVPAGGKESSPVPTEATVATSGVPKDWLQPGWQFPEEGFSLDEAINRLIQKALDQSGDNVSAAARLLGMKRDFIRYRMKAMGK
ncbi:sigma-54 dependent transcriptional regulator [Verrucomicrobiales bacterium]|nr:sigma-54 dependent transcriptional regulator [Verrucomicrobiales bacterium]